MYFNNSSVQQIKDELQYWWTHQDFSDNSIKSLPIHLVDNNVLKALAQNNAQTPIHIRADQTVAYAKVAHLLAAAQNAGLNQVNFLTQAGTAK